MYEEEHGQKSSCADGHLMRASLDCDASGRLHTAVGPANVVQTPCLYALWPLALGLLELNASCCISQTRFVEEC